MNDEMFAMLGQIIRRLDDFMDYAVDDLEIAGCDEDTISAVYDILEDAKFAIGDLRWE